MKKSTLLALCLIIAMLFNFAACSNPNESTETTSTPSTEESTPVESESSDPTDATESTVPDTDSESDTDLGIVTDTDTNADTETESNTDNQTNACEHSIVATNDKCEQVCADCGEKVSDELKHSDIITNDKCEQVCSVCGAKLADELKHGNAVANDNCEAVCSVCGVKVSNEPIHTPATDFVASENNDGTLVKKCIKCGTVVETTNCAHENIEVTYNTDTYKKVTNCSDCGAKLEEDCPHKNSTYSWVEGEAKENKTCTDCTFNEVVDARRVVIFTTCYNNGGIQSPIVEGTGVVTVDFANKPTHIAQHGLVAGQWSYVSGGVKNYVFSVDGGNTWYMVHNTSSGKVATENHYNAVIGKIPSLAGDYQKNIITTVPGAVLMDTRTGNGYGLEVDQAKAVFYAIQAGKITDTNSSFTLMLGAVPIENDTAVVTLTECINVVLSDAEKATVNALIEETKCKHTNVTVNNKCEQICDDCGEKVSDELKHAEGSVSYDKDNYKKIVTCPTCGMSSTVDCPHENITYSWVDGEAKENKTCADCSYNEVIDARFYGFFYTCYNSGSTTSPNQNISSLTTIDFGNKPTHTANHGFVAGQWAYVSGGVKEFVFSVDGGNTWYKVNNLSASSTANIDHYNAVVGGVASFATEYEKNIITTVPGAVKFDTRTGNAQGLEVDQAKAFAYAVLAGYITDANSTYTFMFGAVPRDNDTAVVPMVKCINVVLHATEKTVVNDIVAKANCTHENTGITTNANCEQFCAFCGDKVSEELKHGETTVNANCEQVCSVCGVKVSTELVHTPTDSFVPSETEGVLEKKCTKCGAVVETSTCAHENITVTYNRETYKKVTTCDDCGKVTEVDCTHPNTEITYNNETYKKVTTCTDCSKVTEEACAHTNVTYSWVDGEAKENKTCVDCSYNEVIDARFYGFFYTCYNSGSTTSPNQNISSLTTIDFGNKPTHTANHGFVAGQWAYVSGGVKEFVFSVDGGNTWYKVKNNSASSKATVDHYNAIKGGVTSFAGEYHKNAITTIPGAVLFDTRTGNAQGLDVDQAKAFAYAVLAGYITDANSTYTFMFGAVPNDNDTAVVPMVKCINVVLHSTEKTVVNDIVAKARCQHNDVIGNANCESICSFCGIKVSDEPFHTPANSFVPSETEEGVLVKKCTNCGTILERSNCSHENTKVTYNTETYKKVTTCTDCGNITEGDCPHASNTYSWVEGEAKENKTCSDCTYNEVIDARFVVIFQTTYNSGSSTSTAIEGTTVKTVDFGNKPTHTANHGLVAGQWAYVSGGIKEFVFSVDGGNTWYKVHNAKAGSNATDTHYNAVIGKIPSLATEYEKNIITTVAGAVLFDTRTGNGYGLAVDQAHAVANAINAGYISGIDSSFTLMFGAVPRDNDTAVIPMVKCINVVLQASEKTAIDGLVCKHTNCTYAWVEGEAKEIKTCTDCGREEVIDARFVMNVSSAYNNGASSQAAVEGKSLITVDYGNKPTHAAAHGLVSNGWSYVSGGVKEYVYSVDGGKNWYKVVNLSTKVASEAHYTAITKYYPEMANDTEHSVITGVAGAVMFDTRTGTGNGVEVNQAQAVANAVAAGDIASMTSSFTIILGAVPIENDTAIVPMVQFINVKLP